MNLYVDDYEIHSARGTGSRPRCNYKLGSTELPGTKQNMKITIDVFTKRRPQEGPAVPTSPHGERCVFGYSRCRLLPGMI